SVRPSNAQASDPRRGPMHATITRRIGLAAASVLFVLGVALPAGAVTTGTPYAWGHNNNGQLGSGSTTDRRTPGPVGSLSAVAIGSGREHGLALKGDGTAWAW